MPRADLVRVYPVLLRAAWGRAVAYRGQILLWILTSLFPLIMMTVWLRVVDGAGPAAGLDRADFVSYYVAVAVVNHLTVVWISWEWDEDIRTGGLSVKLLRPLDPAHHHLSTLLGAKALVSLVLLPAAVLCAWLLPDVRYPVGPAGATAAVVAVAVGFALNFAMASTFGVLAFWSTQARNLYGLWWGVGFFLSGWIAPLELFPAGLRRLALVLPFRGALGLPVEILSGRLDAVGTTAGLAVTVAWTAVFLAAYRALWRRGLRRYQAVGA